MVKNPFTREIHWKYEFLDFKYYAIMSIIHIGSTFSSAYRKSQSQCALALVSGVRWSLISPIGPLEHRHNAYRCRNDLGGLPFGHADCRSADQILTIDHPDRTTAVLSMFKPTILVFFMVLECFNLPIMHFHPSKGSPLALFFTFEWSLSKFWSLQEHIWIHWHDFASLWRL